MKTPIVFFGCSMRGGYTVVSREELAKIPDIIEGLGCNLSSRHQTEKNILSKEDLLEKTQIHDRDYKWLLGADVGIFEISNPSLGVGAEISDMVHAGKPVLCVFKKINEDTEKSISAYILGKKGSIYVKTVFEWAAYSSLEELSRIIDLFLDKNIPGTRP